MLPALAEHFPTTTLVFSQIYTMIQKCRETGWFAKKQPADVIQKIGDDAQETQKIGDATQDTQIIGDVAQEISDSTQKLIDCAEN